MAKPVKGTEVDVYAEMLALLSPEEQENLMRLTGQNQGGGGTKTPVVKINYKERADITGVKIPKGNFVLGQASATVDGKKVLSTAGTDLGTELNAVILKVGTQFSFWNDDIKKRCSSQVICERGEKPIGFNLKNVCNDGSCPRRKEGIEKGDRCTNQYIVYLRLPAGTKLPDGTDCPVAMMYIKGTSYKPFQDYITVELKGIPSIALVTKFSTTEEEQGSTIFYVLNIEKGAPVPAAVFKENFQLVGGVDKQLMEYKSEQLKKLTGPSTSSVTPDAVYSPVRDVTSSPDDIEVVW